MWLHYYLNILKKLLPLGSIQVRAIYPLPKAKDVYPLSSHDVRHLVLPWLWQYSYFPTTVRCSLLNVLLSRLSSIVWECPYHCNCLKRDWIWVSRFTWHCLIQSTNQPFQIRISLIYMEIIVPHGGLFNQKGMNVCEHTVMMVPLLECVHVHLFCTD